MEISLLTTFALACGVFSLAPGAGTVASISNSINGGFKTAIVGLIGLQLALITHIIVVSAGLGALLASSVIFFEVLKYAGAAYLIYLGIQKFRNHATLQTDTNAKNVSVKAKIKEGFIVNLMNPKSIVFLAAFLPQFIHLDQPLGQQYFILGSIVVTIDSLVMITYASIGLFAKPILSSQKAMLNINRFFGTAFIGMGIALAKSHK